MIRSDQPTIFDTRALRTIVSSRADGNTSVESASLAEATANIDRIVQRIGATLDTTVVMDVSSDQSHWDTIREVVARDAGAGTRDPADRLVADALVTRVPHVALLLKTADCNPVIMHDPVQRVVALVHLGWQSTTADLAYKVVQFMKQKHQTHPADLRVYAGPAIKAETYVFEGPLAQETEIAWQPFLRQTARGIGIDLIGFIIQRLLEVGVKPDHIETSPIDTARSSDYFSHYRAARSEGDEAEGRFATVCLLV